MDLQPPEQEKQQDALKVGLSTETHTQDGGTHTHTSTVCVFCFESDTYSYDRDDQVLPKEVIFVQSGEEGRLKTEKKQQSQATAARTRCLKTKAAPSHPSAFY